MVLTSVIALAERVVAYWGPVNRAGIWKNVLRCLTCMTKQTHCFV